MPHTQIIRYITGKAMSKSQQIQHQRKITKLQLVLVLVYFQVLNQNLLMIQVNRLIFKYIPLNIGIFREVGRFKKRKIKSCAY